LQARISRGLYQPLAAGEEQNVPVLPGGCVRDAGIARQGTTDYSKWEQLANDLSSSDEDE